MGVGIGIGVGVGVGVSVGADCSLCFSGGGVPCKHIASAAIEGQCPLHTGGFLLPPKWRRSAKPVQQCMGDPPLHAGGFFGKRGSVSASQHVPSIEMEGRFSLVCWRFLQPV